MNGDSLGCIPTPPAEQLRAPRQVDVFLVCEEALVEIVAVDLDVVQHRAAIERGRAVHAEDLTALLILTRVRLAVSTQVLATFAIHEQAGAVDGRLRAIGLD